MKLWHQYGFIGRRDEVTYHQTHWVQINPVGICTGFYILLNQVGLVVWHLYMTYFFSHQYVIPISNTFVVTVNLRKSVPLFDNKMKVNVVFLKG